MSLQLFLMKFVIKNSLHVPITVPELAQIHDDVTILERAQFA